MLSNSEKNYNSKTDLLDSRTCLFVNFHDFRDFYLLVNLVNSTDMNYLNTAGDHVIVTR